jgi:hypothetical protein
MKVARFLFILLSFCTVSVAQGQNYPPNYNPSAWLVEPRIDTLVWKYSLAVMPLSFLGAGLELAYEYHIPNTYNSIRFNAGCFLSSEPFFYYDYKDYLGARVEAQYRIHLLRSEFQSEGFYVGPYLQLKYITMQRNPSYTFDPTTSVTTGAAGFGIIAGKQYRYGNRLMLDFYVGGGFILPTDKVGANAADIPLVNPYNPSITLHGGIGIGLLPMAMPRHKG